MVIYHWPGVGNVLPGVHLVLDLQLRHPLLHLHQRLVTIHSRLQKNKKKKNLQRNGYIDLLTRSAGYLEQVSVKLYEFGPGR